MRYPIGRQSFEYIRQRGLLYVDKTSLIYSLIDYAFVFLARPRRFGKSLLLSTIKPILKGRKYFLKGLQFMRWEKLDILSHIISSIILYFEIKSQFLEAIH